MSFMLKLKLPLNYVRPTIKLYPKMSLSPFAIADFYKPAHMDMVIEGEQDIYSNVTPRFGRHSKTKATKVVMFGLQAYLKDWLINYWTENFFNKPLEEAVENFNQLLRNTVGELGPVREDMIRNLWALGYMPLSIKAIKEGERVNWNIACITINATVEGFGWLVQYIETNMQQELWKPMTAATDAFEFKRMFDFWAEKTSSTPEFTIYQGHCFADRGMDGVYSAAKVGMCHGIPFRGTDSMVGVEEARRLYGATHKRGPIGTSVYAQEHAQSTKYIAKFANEYNETGKFGANHDAWAHVKNDKLNLCDPTTNEEILAAAEFHMVLYFIKDKYPSGIISMIADTLDYWRYVTVYLPLLKDVVMARKPDQYGFAKVTIRPDSSPDYSSPKNIITGFKVWPKAFGTEGSTDIPDKIELDWDEYQSVKNAYSHKVVKINSKFYRFSHTHDYDGEVNGFSDFIEIDEHEVKGTVQVLWEIFGGTVNNKKYKELDSHIGMIYGDSISYDVGNQVCSELEQNDFASTNWIAGIGSYFYQFTTRDSIGLAMKASRVIINNILLSLQKKPKTDPTKNSASGLLRVEKEGNNYVQYQNQTAEQEKLGELLEVFRDSGLLVEYEYDEIRDTLAASKDDVLPDYMKMANRAA